MNESPVTTQ